MNIDLKEYEFVRSVLYDWTGINLGEGKKTLVESRLLPRMRELNLSSFGDYCQYLDATPGEKMFFINSMTTNKTDWFRESEHFDYLIHTVLPAYQKSKEPFLVWSAACSTGEEVYTLAMVLEEFKTGSMSYKILGTDIDTEVLEHAREGIYKSEMVNEQVAAQYRLKYFQRPTHSDHRSNDFLEIRPEIRANIKFRQFNLTQGDLPTKIKFDVIFLRNVLIYFDYETIGHVISRLSSYLKKDGLLFVGHSEALTGVNHQLKQVASAVYRKAA